MAKKRADAESEGRQLDSGDLAAKIGEDPTLTESFESKDNGPVVDAE